MRVIDRRKMHAIRNVTPRSGLPGARAAARPCLSLCIKPDVMRLRGYHVCGKGHANEEGQCQVRKTCRCHEKEHPRLHVSKPHEVCDCA